MDNREALPPGTLLPFPGIPCEIESEIGRGSNSIAYKGRYQDRTSTQEWHQVIVKELFPFHHEGHIFRDEDGSLCCIEDSKSFFECHKESFANGNRVHLQMIRSFPSEIGANINTFHLHGTLYSILGFTGGRSLLDHQAGGTDTMRVLACRFLHILDALSCFHEAGYLHLDVAPDNIILYGTGDRERAMLIDFNSVHPIRGTDEDLLSFHIKTGYAAPEIRLSDFASVSCASDLYSVTAVYYHCLTGEILTPFQMSRSAPPDISECALLKALPDTVCSMVAQILKKGLAALPRRRYQTTEEMRLDFQELIDRIDGIGITHWSLWEAGRKSVVRYIRNNPAFDYLGEDSALFSVSVRRASGYEEPVESCLDSLRSEDGNHMLLVGEGGSGKSTALLRFVLTSQANYSPARPAVLYFSLYNHRYEEAKILPMILEQLHFRTDNCSIEEARRILLRLLDTPLGSHPKKVPTLILLIDGLNEYAGTKDGDRDLLYSEIKVLADLGGVRLLVSSRTPEEKISAETVALLGLREAEVKRILGAKGLALPESPDMKKLLRNPLMLSIFLKSAETTGTQLSISSRNELLDIYFSSLLDKETNGLSESINDRWVLEGAVRYVLPAIAEEIRRKGRPLSDTELLPLVSKLFRLTKTKSFLKLYPSWAGRTSALRGAANDAEEWYGMVIHRILWKRLALLVRWDQQTYQLPHEIICFYLADKNRDNAGKLLRRQTFKHASALLLVMLLIIALSRYAWQSSTKVPLQVYDEELETIVLGLGDSAFDYASDRAEALSVLVDSSYSPKSYEKALLEYEDTSAGITASSVGLRTFDDASDDTVIGQAVASLLESGDAFSASSLPLDQENFSELYHLEQELEADYDPLVETLSILVEDERLDKAFGEKYRSLLKELTDADADYAGILYYLTVAPNIPKLLKDKDTTFAVLSFSTYQKKHNPDTLSYDELIVRLNETQIERGSGLDGIRTKIRGTVEAIQKQKIRYDDSQGKETS